MRLLILLGIIYLAYRFLRSWMLKENLSQKAVFGKKNGEIDNVMVKDPQCGIYFAKKDGVHLNINGQDLYFCSKECEDMYLGKKAKE